jgi:hypothetical protein
LGPEIATSKTHGHKITNVPDLLYGAWTKTFGARKFIIQAIGDVGPENLNYFGPKKVSILRAYPFQWPL